ncbi:MAG: Gfo/Idh/MocA family oxidoreductase [Actinobacteria bacterium]|nr:Gfo/Idh/MocA family oxidoreductase [Actinomycetota bacterium]MDA3017433.1 Gfo/Idh/MocA family oxidoreductase [Actinomycetota bacterium]
MSTDPIRVGLLAYGAIGYEHNLAVQNTKGMALTAVCDAKPERIAAARELAQNFVGFSDATEMLDSGLLDLVVISTPPNSHFQWAKEALNRNINVVLEKPMALTADECDELIKLANDKKLLLVVYQNRRFDADFVTMRSLIRSGVIGEVYQLDTFVGGYSRPCDHWHSDSKVSGGAIFDWGSHFIDQILNLISNEVVHVSGQNHKRVWTHATNADHAQVMITFKTGKQASFIHSDLAAARKPKFYVLGTLGAIVGDWNALAEPAVADLPAILTLYRQDGTSQVIELEELDEYEFHKSIVDYLTAGIPMSVTALQSRNVVAIMQAAEESALNNAMPVVPKLRASISSSLV